MAINPFRLDKQQQNCWCWASTTEGAIRFFASRSPVPAQCEIVNQATNRSDCCWNGNCKDCNKYEQIDRILKLYGHHHSFIKRPATDAEIQSEAARDRPLVAYIEFTTSGKTLGHFIVISEALGKGRYMLHDPAGGTKKSLHMKRIIRYQGGQWLETHFLRP